MSDAQTDQHVVLRRQTLPPAALTYENVRAIATGLPVAGALIAVAVFIEVDWIAFVGLWVLLPLCLLSMIVDVAVVNRLRYRSYSYSADTTTVDIRHGVIVRSQTTIATVQVLSVDLVRGPLLRMCGLSAVVLRTIGGTTKLGPVTPSEADAVRTKVMRAVEIVPR